MPAVDVDVTAIPDMIEAQLTLSYSRLAHLVRLIVDQGNGHDLDIDKLTSRIDSLTRENAELRSLVDSLMADRTSDIDVVRREVETLRGELARVSDACVANTERIATSDAENAKRHTDMNNSLQAHMERAAAALQQSTAASATLSDDFRALERALHITEDFVALWGSDPTRAANLSRLSDDSDRGTAVPDAAPAEGGCTEYLHSLPAFVRVFEELEVVRQMLRQQAADALTAKTVAGAIRRSSAAEAAAVATAANAIERGAIESLQAAFEDMNRRVRTVETKRLPPLEQAARFQMQSLSRAEAPAGAESGDANFLMQLQKESQFWVRREDILPLVDRMHQMEERLRGFAFHVSDGAGIEQAVLSDMDGRIRALEDIIEGSSREILRSEQEEDQEPEQQQEEGGEQPQKQQQQQQQQPNKEQKQEGQSSMSASMPPHGNATNLSSSHESHRKDNMEGISTDRPASSPLPSYLLPVDQPNVALYRCQSSAPGSVEDPENHVQLSLKQNDGLRRRVALLEENCAILEMHKANRRELQQLGQALFQSVSVVSPRGVIQKQQQQRQPGIQVSAAGSASSAPYPYPMFGQQLPGVPCVPQRPTTAQDGRAAADGRMGYAAESAQGSGSIPIAGGGMSAMGRPMFIGNNAHFLRDTTGIMTHATVAPSLPR